MWALSASIPHCDNARQAGVRTTPVHVPHEFPGGQPCYLEPPSFTYIG